MYEVIVKASSFVIIIILGYTCKRIGFMTKDDSRVMAKIMTNFTLPGAVIVGFSQLDEKINAMMMAVVLLGIVFNAIMLFLGWLFSKGKGWPVRALYMASFPGYNIGCFALPFITAFLGPFGVVITCMYDAGNSMMMVGGSILALAKAKAVYFKTNWREELANIKKLVNNFVPLSTYLVMLTLSILGLKLPGEVVTLASTIGSASAFVGMFTVGLLLEISTDIVRLKEAGTIVATRFVTSCIFASISYFILPLSLPIRQTLTLISFAPIASICSIITGATGGDSGVSSFATSCSVFVSVIAMMALSVAMGIGTF